MRRACYLNKLPFVVLSLLVMGCGLLLEEPPKKSLQRGLITTPPAYYSTQKGRYLGERYKENLDRLVDRIVRNPKTANLQFANNIASVGGIGFFTHSAAKTSDERYLEVILGAPETFATKGEYSAKVDRLFSLYGSELLTILLSDSDIYQERDVSGYGLNLAWRRIAPDPSGARVALERAIVYFPKQRARDFLKREASQSELLAQAVIFAVEDDGPMNLVSYRSQEPKPDLRAVIQEETLAVARLEAEPSRSQDPALQAIEAPKFEKRVGDVDVEQSKEDPPPILPQPRSMERNEEVKKAPTVADKPSQATVKPREPARAPAKQAKPAEQKVIGPVAVGKAADTMPQFPEIAVTKPESVSDFSLEAPIAREAAPPVAQSSKSPQAEASEPLARPAEKPKAAGAKSPPSVAAPKAELAPRQPAPSAKVADIPSVASRSTESQRPQNIESAAVRPQEDRREKIQRSVQEERTEVASVVPTAESQPRPAESPGPRLAESPKQEKLGETKSQEPVSAKPEANMASPRPRPVEEKKLEPKPEARAPEETIPKKSANEQIALLRNPPTEIVPEKKPLSRPAARPLEGFIIQLGFNDKGEAQRWAETLERRGHAVSVTEAGAGSLRVRIGNFPSRSDAERQLQRLRQDGLSGIVLNLPQAYRPDVSMPAAEGAAKASVAP